MVSLPLLWQSASGLVPSVVGIILQLLNLGGGGLNFLNLLALIAGAVTATGLDIGLGLLGFILAPSILVFAL
jgi:hypothetical protein